MDDKTDLDDVLYGAPADTAGATYWKSHDGWWFSHDGAPVGPYDTKSEAREARAGLLKFDRFKDKPGFITTDRPPQTLKG